MDHPGAGVGRTGLRLLRRSSGLTPQRQRRQALPNPLRTHPASFTPFRETTAARLVLAGALFLTGIQSTAAQQPTEDEQTRLAKATQNPVADLVSLPFQFNFNTGGGFEDQTFFNLNFQPVVPVKGVLRDWTIIARTIIPYVSVPTGPASRDGGLGDFQEQLFVTPAKSGSLIWGVGPIFSIPTATADPVRTGSWALGPTAVLVKSEGAWVTGALVNNLWTFADEGGDPEVNQFLLQPFINYNFGKGWALTTAPIITANWDAPDGEEWTIPIGAGLIRTTSFNGRPMSIGFQYYHNVEHPTAAAANLFRVVVSLLYPSRPKP